VSSMSYCRFQNALGDLQDCESALNETGGDLERLSPEEHRAAVKLINLCRRIGEDWGEQS
jgi:hypothetical protein